MSDTESVLLTLIGFIIFMVIVVGALVTSLKRTKRNCPKCNKPTTIANSYYEEEDSGKQVDGTVDITNGYFRGILEIVVGILSFGFLIFMIYSDTSSGDCSLDGFSIICNSSSVSTTTGLGWYIFPLLLGCLAPFDGIKSIRRVIASKGKLMECHFKCAHCKTEWTESIKAGGKISTNERSTRIHGEEKVAETTAKEIPSSTLTIPPEHKVLSSSDPMKLNPSVIITCPYCKMRVIPKLDGTCPSCQARIVRQ